MSDLHIEPDPTIPTAIIETIGDAHKPGELHIVGKGSTKITLCGNGKDATPPNTPQLFAHLVDHAFIDVEGDVYARDIYAEDSKRQVTIHLDGENRKMELGSKGVGGALIIRNDEGEDAIALGGDFFGAALVTVRGVIAAGDKQGSRILLDGPKGNLWVGGDGASGDILLFPPSATNNNEVKQAAIHLSGQDGDIWLGGTSDTDGDLLLFRKGTDNHQPGQASIHLAGQGGVIFLGGGRVGEKKGVNGSVWLFRDDATDNHDPNQASIRLDGQAGDINLAGNMNAANINLAGNMNAANINLTGDLILQNADCAEEFDIAADAAEVEPGTVMVVDEDGTLRPSEEAFDRRVAGVISGAGDYKPGIVLDRQYSTNKRLPIALVGKVFCKVDADHGAIQVGDLLTSSPTPGHAMKAGDPLKAFGAVLGKALRPLQSGQGLIPVLVALQ